MTDPRWEFTVSVTPVADEDAGVVLSSCTKRYSEFDELQNTMCAELGEVAWPSMPQLPPPHTVPGIGKLFDTAEVAQQRRMELHAYLQDLLSVPGAANSMSLANFLAIDPSHGVDCSLEFVSTHPAAAQ